MSDAGQDVQEHGDHVPAPEDWPRGFGEASFWPIATAVGVAGIYVGAALFLLGQSDATIVPSPVGAGISGVGFVVFVASILGWLYHGFVSDYWSRSVGDYDRYRWGMLLFLGSEIATFGAGFVYYFYIRVRPWPPGHLPDLLSSLVLINTVVLVASSVTLHLAHSSLRRGDRTRFRRLLGATLGLGLVFLLGQAWEYYQFIVEEGFTFTQGIYASGFFGLTGLHGLHVTLGAVLLGIVFVRGVYGQYSADRHTSVTTVSMYWHFVDVVWMFLVVTLYLGASVSV